MCLGSWCLPRRTAVFSLAYEAASLLGGRERNRDFSLFKVRQLLPQLDLRQSISVKKKKKNNKEKLVGGFPSPPLVATCSCLAIHLPAGSSHCSTDGLTRRWEAASHTAQHRGLRYSNTGRDTYTYTHTCTSQCTLTFM